MREWLSQDFIDNCQRLNRIHVVRWKIQSLTLDASLYDVNWEGDFFSFVLTGRSRNEMSPCSIRGSYMDVVKLIPALTKATPVPAT